MAQSDLFQSEGAALQEKTKRAQEGWAKKERDLQSKAAQLQEKYQKGLITTANAQSEQEKIQRQIANYQSVAQKEAQTLDEENYVFTNRAQDLIHRAVQELNADKKYKLILNATSLVDADSLLDITPLVLAKVNELYAADKKAIRSRRPAADASVYRSDKIPTPCGKSVFFSYFCHRNLRLVCSYGIRTVYIHRSDRHSVRGVYHVLDIPYHQGNRTPPTSFRASSSFICCG